MLGEEAPARLALQLAAEGLRLEIENDLGALRHKS